MALTTVLSLGAVFLRYIAGEQTVKDTKYMASQDAANIVILRPAMLTSYPWTLLTTTFVEPNFFFLLYGLFALATVGSFLERQWGTRGYVQVVAVLAIVPVVVATAIVVCIGVAREDSVILYDNRIGGLSALLSGLTVGLKQLVPEHTVKLFRGRLGFRMNDLPGFYTLIFPIIYTLLDDLPSVILVNVGFLAAFVFLRFYRYESNGGVRGDRSEAFAFCTFFPEFVRPVVRRLDGVVYWLAVKLRLVASEDGYRQAAEVDLDLDQFSPSGGPLEVVVTGGSDVDESAEVADRRRALAAKVLDMRLGSGGNKTSSVSASALAGAN
ncbi:hypothetical protein LPJ66_009574 [Kickxella alabastrina]|uniref:Uncharacterized protein n=1 Tax=Kickxella alabastrina TaxID=61397 RepID=A0ACC1I4G8_9FUNG|nr:hypothetical protein LPJ66_009574 [Kickxella alabastrina]